MATCLLAEQSAVRSVALVDVRATYVVDGAMELRVDRFFPDVPARYWADHPEACARPGWVAASAGGLLVQRQGRSMLIDAGLGVGRSDSGVAATNSGALLDTLIALGHVPQDVEALAFTHLHTDHTGWGFVRDADGTLVKTFPEARYLVTEASASAGFYERVAS
jgi:glyoxylase-like metal-dependent hydrolase (beta-lactamase superfamily II)